MCSPLNFARRSRLLGAALCALLVGVPAFARADDPQPKTFLALNATTYQSSAYIDANGVRQVSGCTFIQQSESAYVQHEITPRDAFFGSLAYLDATCGGTTRGFGDLEVGEQHGLSGKSHPNQFALRSSIIIPTGYSIAANPRLGLGRPALTEVVQYLGGWQAGPHHYGFVSAGVGARVYTSYPAPILLTNFTAGLKVTPGVLIMQGYWGTTSLGNGGQLQNIGINPLVSAKYSAYQVVTSATFDMTKSVGLNVQLWNPLGGRNFGIGQNVGAGLWIRF